MPRIYRFIISSKLLSDKLDEYNVQTVNEIKLIDIGIQIHTDEHEIFIAAETQLSPSTWLIQSNVKWQAIKEVCKAINDQPVMFEVDNYLCKLIIHY